MSQQFDQDRADKTLREQLQRAVRSETAPAHLQTRIRMNLEAARRPSFWNGKLAVAAAAALAIIGTGIAYQLGHLRITAGAQESYIAAVSNQVATLMRAGLGDHIHCSVFRKSPKHPEKVEDLAKELPAGYRGLSSAVRERVPAGFEMLAAHECRYHKRKFVHLSFRGEDKLLSLVITRKEAGESFQTEQLLPTLAQSDLPVYRAGVQHFQIAAFESRDHLVYVVSDLPQQKNMDMILALAPSVKDYLGRLEL